MRHLMEKAYTWEELSDISDDIYDSLCSPNGSSIEGEYEGTIKVQVIYSEDKHSLEDWEE